MQFCHPGDATHSIYHQGVQLCNVYPLKAERGGILQSWGCNFAGFVTFATGFGGRQSPWQRLVKRMTRFFTKLDADGSYRTLKEVCEKMGYGWKKSCTNQVGIGVQNRGGGWDPTVLLHLQIIWGIPPLLPFCRSPSRPRTGGTTNSSSR